MDLLKQGPDECKEFPDLLKEGTRCHALADLSSESTRKEILGAAKSMDLSGVFMINEGHLYGRSWCTYRGDLDSHLQHRP